MHSSLRTLYAVVATIVIAAPVSTRLTHAQAPLLPSVAIAYTGFEPGDVWPADLNRDGVTDLVGRAFDPIRQLSTLAVARGHGDGTYDAPVTSPYQATPWAVGDLNRDGRIDVLAISNEAPDDRRTLIVAAGNGNGTLGHASTIASTGDTFTFALIADMDGNGTRDIVVGEEPDLVSIYSGNGDLTFSPPVTLVTGRGPRDGIVADFNGDGLRDIAVANDEAESLSIFINGGALLFDRSDVALDRAVSDITVRDLTGDGIVDLVIAAADHDKELFGEGRVYVLSGNGNGTFEPPAVYETGRGAFRVVVGDFTHDGRLDIATGNRSAVSTACGGSRLTYWDTVSILEGRSDGTFAQAVNFSLSTGYEPFDATFTNTLTSLNTSDLDGDGHTDLIASGGAILLSRAPRANSAPAAQPDALFADGPVANLLGHASDPDFHALTFTWTNEEGRVVGTEPSPCVAVPTGDSVFTLTVDDGHGGVASENVAAFLPTEQVLEIVSPSDFDNETTLRTNEPYEIRWRRTPNLFSSFDVFVQEYGEEGGAMTPVPGCQDVPGTASGCTWQQPGPASTEHRQFVVRGHRTDGVRDAVGFSAPFDITDSGALPLPIEWQSNDVGATVNHGSAQAANGVFTIAGSGADIWGTADGFQFAYQRMSGNGVVTARVASIQNTNAWAKAGVMIRETTSPGSRHAFSLVSAERGMALQYRPTTGGTSATRPIVKGAAPQWVKLERRANTFISSVSIDGTTWQEIGRATIPMGAEVLAGLAVTSHDTAAVATAVFDGVTFVR